MSAPDFIGPRHENAHGTSTPKGDYLCATITKKGRAAAELLSEALPKEIAALYWAKNMYWRAGKPERFVRPVRWMVALLDALAGQADHHARAELVADVVEQAQAIATALPTVIRRVKPTVEIGITGFDAQQIAFGAGLVPGAVGRFRLLAH